MLKLLLGDERNMVNSQTSSHLEQKNTAMDVKQEKEKLPYWYNSPMVIANWMGNVGHLL